MSGSHRKMAAFGAVCSEIEICDSIGRSMSHNEPTISLADGGAEASNCTCFRALQILEKYFRLNGTHCDLELFFVYVARMRRPLDLF